MKKFSLLFILIAISTTLFAQNKSIQFGAKAGLTFSKFSQTSNGLFGEDPKNLTSFYVGATVDVPLISFLSLQTGLTFIEKGNLNTYNVQPVNVVIDDKVNISYLELPLNFLANFAVAKHNVFVGAGPYYAIGIGGKHQYEGTLGGLKDLDEQDVNFGSGEEDDFQRSDFGINFTAGFEFKRRLNLHVGYGLGLKDISNSQLTDFKQKNTTISFGLGFKF